MKIDIESMISSYIDGGISDEDKIIFENYMDKNPEFSKKVHIMANMITQFNNQNILTPSDHFLDNLHSKINELSENKNNINLISETNSNHWFNVNFKTTLGFSFAMLFIGIFFMGRMLTPENEVNMSNSDNLELEGNSTLLSDSDTLKTNDVEFPIHQVKGSSTNK